MKTIVLALLLICNRANAEMLEVPSELFDDSTFLQTVLQIKTHSYSIAKIENHSSSSQQGVSLQVFRFVPLADGYLECVLKTRVEENAPSGVRVAIAENNCPQRAKIANMEVKP